MAINKKRKKINTTQLVAGERIVFTKPILRNKIIDFFAETISYIVQGFKYIKHKAGIKPQPVFEFGYIGRAKPISNLKVVYKDDTIGVKTKLVTDYYYKDLNSGSYTREERLAR